MPSAIAAKTEFVNETVSMAAIFDTMALSVQLSEQNITADGTFSNASTTQIAIPKLENERDGLSSANITPEIASAGIPVALNEQSHSQVSNLDKQEVITEVQKADSQSIEVHEQTRQALPRQFIEFLWGLFH